MDYLEILKALPMMDDDQLDSLRDRIILLRTKQGDRSSSTILAIISRLMGRGFAPPEKVLRKHVRWPKFEEHCIRLVDFVMQHSAGLSGFEALLVVAIKASIQVLTNRAIPVRIWTLGIMFGTIGEVMEDQFPGYAASGLLGDIPRLMKHSQQH